MAGPLSSEEIEDVVSSVRRLVSNEQRVLTRDLNAERLVLTSAYRVVPETSPLSPLMLDAPLVDAPPEPAPEAAPVAADVVEDVSAPEATDPLEDSLAQALAVDVQPELTGEVDDQASPSRPAATMTDTVEGEWEDEIWAEPGQVSLGEVALAAEEAEVLTAAEPEAAETDVLGGDAPSDDASSAWVDEPIPFVPLRRRAEDLAARLAAGGVVEPPAAAPDPESPDPVPADQPSAQVAADGTAAPAPDASPVATDLYDADGVPLAVLDETALNEIVRQVLRAELQGELGERITRNVRKLVRAEINRALLARDLD